MQAVTSVIGRLQSDSECCRDALPDGSPPRASKCGRGTEMGTMKARRKRRPPVDRRWVDASSESSAART